MATIDWDEATFEAYRPLLFSIVYQDARPSASEAEDVVQDAWLRARPRTSTPTSAPPRAYLTTIVTRLCIDHLRSTERTRMEYPGPWLPEPLAEPNQESVELASSLKTAFLVLMEQLAPTERAVFLLREVFELDFDEIARSVGKSEANTRQILTRARARLRDSRPRFTVSRRESEEIVRQFPPGVRHRQCRRADGGAARRRRARLRWRWQGRRGHASGGRRGSHREVHSRLCRQNALVGIGLPARHDQRRTRSVHAPSALRLRHLLVRHRRAAAFARSTSCATPTSCVGSSSTRIDPFPAPAGVSSPSGR